MKKVIIVISFIAVSCLMPPPPKYYNYNLIKEEVNNTKFSILDSDFSAVYTGNHYLKSVLHLKLLNVNYTNQLDIKSIALDSKLLKSDAIEIYLKPDRVPILPYTPLNIKDKDTINLLIYFLDKNRIKTIKRKDYLNSKQTDTVTINLNINKETYQLFYK